MKKEFKVNAIENGTVIDHVPSGSLFKVIEILGLQDCDSQLTLGMNLESKKLGRKAILKITDRFFEDDEINRIVLVAPNAKLNIIRNFEVIEKRQVELPDTIEGIVKCVNPKCITNAEQVKTKFHVVNKKEVQLQCCYCEKITGQDQISVL